MNSLMNNRVNRMNRAMSKKETLFDDDKLHEECGVFGVVDHDDAAALTALGLHALQHRGQEACGIVTYDGEGFFLSPGAGPC